jgi:hypothetical protein
VALHGAASVGRPNYFEDLREEMADYLEDRADQTS